MQSTVSIGKLVATFGLKGELVLEHGLQKKTDLNGLKVLFVEVKRGSQLPYFIESARAKSAKEVWIKFQQIDSKEQATLLLQKQVWVEESELSTLAAKTSTIALLGFGVVEKGQQLGVIASIIEQPHQVLCAIFMNDKEVLIPLHEQTIVKVDRKAKQIHVNLPEGLLDIYLT